MSTPDSYLGDLVDQFVLNHDEKQANITKYFPADNTFQLDRKVCKITIIE